MIRVSLFHRNGFEEHFHTTDVNAVNATVGFCNGDSTWIERHEKHGDSTRWASAKIVDFSEVSRIEIGRIDD
jgi:hypothetical protein